MPPNVFNPTGPAIPAATSAHQGFLRSINAQFPEAGDLDDFMQWFTVGITGLYPDRVRPRYQVDPPNFPSDAEWAAVGVVENDPEPGWAYEWHDGRTSAGRDVLQQHEVFTFLTSFYGPRCDYYDAALRDGVQLSQNRECLQRSAMGLVDAGTKTVVPRLINQRWRRRVDRRFRFRRLVREVYLIRNILSVAFRVDMQDQGDNVLEEAGVVPSPSTL